MNYIKQLKNENEKLKNSIYETINELIEYQRYFNSSKFSGIENDFAHVSTDVYLKITNLKNNLQNSLNNI
jgi:septation ring formation regulator EzrA